MNASAGGAGFGGGVAAWWERWLARGVPVGSRDDLAKRIRLNNGVGLAIIAICLAYLVLWAALGLWPLVAGCAGLVVGSWASCWIAGWGRHHAARVVMVITGVLGVVWLAVALGPRSGYHVILFSGVTLPAVFFTAQERVARWALVAFSVAWFLVLELDVLAPYAMIEGSDLFFRLVHLNGGLVSLFFLYVTVQLLIRENTQAERTLEGELARGAATVAHMADGLVATLPDGQLHVANPAFWRVLGVAPVALTRELPASARELLARAVATGEVCRGELALPEERVGSAVASPIEGGGAVLIVRDVTLEREVDRMKSNFIATVSHELRTPLTSLLGFASVTRRKLEQRVFPHVPEDDRPARSAVEQVKGNLDIMIAEGTRLTTLINDVLDLSKMEAGRMVWRREEVDPVKLVERAAAATAALFGGPVALVVERVEPLPLLVGDFDRLLQVLINLLSNASKFTRQGAVTLRAEVIGGQLALSVRDTGIGIPQAELASVFEKFKQVQDVLTDKPAGTGLGLSIAREIAAAHGGTLDVESEVGAGSCFTLRLPLA